MLANAVHAIKVRLNPADFLPTATRLYEKPLITPSSHISLGDNINGPSLIKVPGWVEKPLGRYYLYFAHHSGKHIRLAYADSLEGPWLIHEPGTLRLGETPCLTHIASPDVHVDPLRKKILMYFHGDVLSKQEAKNDALSQRFPILDGQRTLLAESRDGVSFRSFPQILGPSYMRVFRFKNYFYALGMPGLFLRSEDGLKDFEPGPVLWNPRMRHSAVRVSGDYLDVFYSDAGGWPERIIVSRVDCRSEDWMRWNRISTRTILRPEKDYEGGRLPLLPSRRGAVHYPVRQLRDPCIYEEDNQAPLLYSIAGESGIAAAQLTTETR